MVVKQEYDIKQAKAQGDDIQEFEDALIAFGVPGFANKALYREFIELIYDYVRPDKVTLVKHRFTTDSGDTYSLYSDGALLARFRNGKLVKLGLPGLKRLNGENYFLMTTGVNYITHASFPDLEQVGEDFMAEAHELKFMYTPKLKKAGDNFGYYADSLETFFGPNLNRLGNHSLFRAEKLRIFYVPKLTNPGEHCLYNNDAMKSISLPSVEKLPKGFMFAETNLEEVEARKLKDVGINCADIFYDVMYANRAAKRR